jgi:hypothetical protein
MKRTSLFCVVCLICISFSTIVPPASAQSPLDGAWEVTTAQSGDLVSNQAGLYIFHGQHYSVLHVWSDEARPLYEDDETRTSVDREKMDAIVGPVEGNSGRFEVDGATVTLTPLVAISPNFMSGGSSSYRFSISGDVLTLRTEGRGLTLTRVH